MPKVLLACLVACLPTATLAADWWVVTGFFDHPPMEWDDGILVQGNGLEADLNACGLSAYWDFAAKFDGFDTDGRGTVFVVFTPDLLDKPAAEILLERTLPCVPDAYIKEAIYFGE